MTAAVGAGDGTGGGAFLPEKKGKSDFFSGLALAAEATVEVAGAVGMGEASGAGRGGEAEAALRLAASSTKARLG